MLIERLSQQALDDCLSADVQFLSRAIQLLKHRHCKVHIDALDCLGAHQNTLVREKSRYTLSGIGHLSDPLSIERWGRFTNV